MSGRIDPLPQPPPARGGSYFVACGLGLGRLPWAPGSWASLAAAAVGAGLLSLSPWALAAAALAVMGDDVIAGAIGAALLLALRAAAPGSLD